MAKQKPTPEQHKKNTLQTKREQNISQWFSKNFKVLTLSILIVAAMLRLSLLLELPHMPLSKLYKAPDLDMNFFDQWGDRIAGGDALTDTIWHPYHFWHDAIAKSIGLETEEQGKQKWNEWYGGKKYHQEPLYALIVGFAKKITGEGHLLVYILQLVLSLLSIWMIMWLGKHYFGALAGCFAGILFTFYGPALQFDVTLLRTSFSTTVLLGCLVVYEQLVIGKRRAWLMGMIGGAGYLLMTTTLLLWLPLVIRWLYLRRLDLNRLWKVALPFCLCIGFLIVRNSITNTPLLSSSSVGPITYVLANFPEYKPEMGFIFFASAGKIMEETQGKMIPSVRKVIGMHDTIWGWVLLQFKKLGAIFHWYEIPNNVNTYLASTFSHTLQFTFVPYSLIAALGLMGLFLNLRNKEVLSLHYAVLTQIAIMVIFYVLCRFRIPMVAMLCIFGGYTIQQIIGFTRWKRTALISLSVVGMWVILLRPIKNMPPTYTRGDLNTNFNAYYRPLLNELAGKGDLGGCVRLVEEFLQSEPAYIRHAVKPGQLKSPIEKDVAYYYGLVYGDLGNLYHEMGNESKANISHARSKILYAAAGAQ